MLFLPPGIVARSALVHAMVPFEVEDDPDLSGVSVLLTGAGTILSYRWTKPNDWAATPARCWARVELTTR